MERSAATLHVGDVDQSLITRAVAGTLSESDRRILDAAIRGRVMNHITKRLEQFAKRVVGPQLELKKALKSATEKDPSLEGKKFRQVASPSRVPPAPTPRSTTGRLPLPPFAPFWSVHYAPPYSWSDPGAEVDVPGGGFAVSAKIELARPDGNLSIGGAVGGGGALGLVDVPDLGAGDRWMFGDASIAIASVTQLATFPGWGTQRTMNVSADIVVGNGAPSVLDGTWLGTEPVPVSGAPGGLYVHGWIGVLGDIILFAGPGALPSEDPNSIWEEFVFNWITGFIGGGPAGPYGNYYLQPKFSVSGTFDVPPRTTASPITVTAWGAALRLTSVDGYETDGATFQFLDPASVTGVIVGSGGPGPIKVTGIDAFMI